MRQPEALPERTVIALTRDGGYLFAPAHINGQNAGMYMIDTGATLTVVEPGTANRLGLPRAGTATTLGVGGTERFEWRQVASFALDNRIDLAPGRVAALDLFRITHPMRVSVRGILGYRSFGTLPLTLNGPAQTLTLHRPDTYRPPPGAHRSRLIPFRNLPVVAATVGRPPHTHTVWLILDTGAHNELTLPLSCMNRWPDILATPHHGSGQTLGVGGAVSSHSTWVNRLNLLGVTLKDVPTNFEPAPPGLDQMPYPVGRVGNALLRHFQLSFDPRSGPRHETLHSLFTPPKKNLPQENQTPRHQAAEQTTP